MKRIIPVIIVVFVILFFSGCAPLYERVLSNDMKISEPAFVEFGALDDNGKKNLVGDIKENLTDPNGSVRSKTQAVMVKIGRPAVPVLIETLTSPNETIRESCEESLVRIGEPAIPFLLEALKGSNSFIRLHAVYALGNIKPSNKEVVRGLISTLKDNSNMIKAASRDSLIKVGNVDVAGLIEALKEDNKLIRFYISYILGKLQSVDSSAVPYLLEVLKDSDTMIRSGAGDTLVKIGLGNAEAVKALAGSLGDANYSGIKQHVINILGNIGPSAKEYSGEVFKLINDPDKDVKMAAIAALVKIDADSAKTSGALIGLLKDNNAEIRASAASALGGMKAGLKEIAAALPVSFGDKYIFARKAAEESLIRIINLSDKEAINIILNGTKDRDKNTRLSSANILGGIISPGADAVKLLILMLKDSEPEIRAAAANALSNIGVGAASSIPGLIELLKDREVFVQFAGKAAIKKIGSISREAVESIAGFLRDDNLHVSMALNEIVFHIGPMAITPLTNLLKEKEKKVKIKALTLLGRIGKTVAMVNDAVPDIVICLKDPDKDVCVAAADAIGEIMEKSNFEKIVGGLTEALKDSDSSVRYAAVKAMGNGRPGNQDEYIKKIVPFVIMSLKDENNNVKMAAKESLLKIAMNNSVSYLEEALKDPDTFVRSTAKEALENIKTPDADQVLRQYKLK